MKRLIAILVLLAAAANAFAAVEIERVVVNGFCRAWKYYNSAGKVTRIDLFHDTTVSDYGNAATVGSIAWAAGLLLSLIHI